MHSQKKKQSVYTLLVQVGRKPGDDLPVDATGALLICYASGVSEDEAVRETVSILKQAGMAPLDVTGYGTVLERQKMGHAIPKEEMVLMERALSENAVIVASIEMLFEDGGAA